MEGSLRSWPAVETAPARSFGARHTTGCGSALVALAGLADTVLTPLLLLSNADDTARRHLVRLATALGGLQTVLALGLDGAEDCGDELRRVFAAVSRPAE